MATATKPRPSPRSSATRKARAQAGRPKPSAQAIKKRAAGSTAKSVARNVKPGGSGVKTKLARTVAKKTFKTVARAALRTSAKALEAVAERGGSLGKQAVENTVESEQRRLLPIQVGVDVAAPIQVVWDEWVGSDSLPEGVHRIEEVQRDGDQLSGTVAGPRARPWEAEIVDERECESFAWRSREGTDCAGLATFHELSDRLTRVELDLDVLPTNPAEALTMSLHVAHRHALADLRRFKARVEFINPDVYESNGNHKAGASKKRARR